MRRFQELRVVTVEDIGWLLDKAGPEFLRRHRPTNSCSDGLHGSRDESGSGYRFRFYAGLQAS
jgi:hypothetical protein